LRETHWRTKSAGSTFTSSPITLAPLKGNGFKIETRGEEKVGDKPAVVLKIIGPDGKDFTLYLDKESGMPVKQVAKVAGFQGHGVYPGYNLRRLQGLRRHHEGHQDRSQGATARSSRIWISRSSRFLDKVDADTFAEPK